MALRLNAGRLSLLAIGLLAYSCKGAPAAGNGYPNDGTLDSAGEVEVVDGARIRRGGEWIFDVGFSPDGKSVVAATRLGINGYSVDSFAPAFSLKTENIPTCVDYSADGKTVAYGTDAGEVHRIAAAGGIELQTIAAKNGRINTLAFSPDGSLLAAGLADHTVVLWDAATGSPVGVLEGHAFQVDSLSFSPDGSLLASGSVTASMLEEGAVLIVWDAESGEVVQRMTRQSDPLPIRPPVGVFFLPDGERVASLSTDGMYIVWDVASGEKLRTVELEFSGGGSVFGLSPDGSTIAVGAISGDISLYDAENGKRIRLNGGQSGLSSVESIAFSPDGNMLASGTVDGALALWDLTHWR